MILLPFSVSVLLGAWMGGWMGSGGWDWELGIEKCGNEADLRGLGWFRWGWRWVVDGLLMGCGTCGEICDRWSGKEGHWM